MKSESALIPGTVLSSSCKKSKVRRPGRLFWYVPVLWFIPANAGGHPCCSGVGWLRHVTPGNGGILGWLDLGAGTLIAGFMGRRFEWGATWLGGPIGLVGKRVSLWGRPGRGPPCLALAAQLSAVSILLVLVVMSPSLCPSMASWLTLVLTCWVLGWKLALWLFVPWNCDLFCWSPIRIRPVGWCRSWLAQTWATVDPGLDSCPMGNLRSPELGTILVACPPLGRWHDKGGMLFWSDPFPVGRGHACVKCFCDLNTDKSL